MLLCSVLEFLCTSSPAFECTLNNHYLSTGGFMNERVISETDLTAKMLNLITENLIDLKF